MKNKLKANKDNLKHDIKIPYYNNTYETSKLSNLNIVEEEFDELDKYLMEREKTLTSKSNDVMNKTFFKQTLNNSSIIKSIDIQSKVSKAK